MNFTVKTLFSKLHRAVVTDANIDYVGSVTVDRELCEKSGIKEGMQVDIVDVSNGARLSTYVIYGHSGQICINGAAAHLVHKGDIVIIIAYADILYSEVEKLKPNILILDKNNKIQEIKKEI